MARTVTTFLGSALHVATLVLLGSFSLPLQATAPRLSSTTPWGAQRGTELEVRFAGDRLQDTQEIIFYSPGLETVKLVAVESDVVKARIKIASNCRLGEHHVRLRAQGGISELRTFYVGPFPTVGEVEPNNQPDKAQTIEGNTTITGSITSEDTDYFLITAQQGERISIEIEAMRLGREPFDAFISLQDRQGKVIATSDDTALLMQDGLISVLAPKEGTYVVQLRDASYGGNAGYVYRLHLGNFPRPTAVYPAGGPAGETIEARFIGDGGGDLLQKILLPSQPQQRFGVFAEQEEKIAPSPNWVRVSTFPNVLESEPNNSREQAATKAHPLPIALNGIIAEKGDRDWFPFVAKKGEALDISVYARRLRSGLDSYLDVYDAQGKNLASNDDASGADSSLKFTPPADGTYWVRVKDQLDQGAPDFVYRVEITPVRPSLTLSIPQVARYDSQTRQYIVVPQGNRFATLISAKRGNFSGDLKIEIPGLPAEIVMDAVPMAARVDAMPIVFEAEPNAPIRGRLLDLEAHTTNHNIGGKFIHNLELVRGPNNTFYYETSVDQLFVGVTEPVPFRIKIIEPKVPLVQYGTIDLQIEAERQAGFDEAINVKMLWNPPGIGSLPDVTIPEGQNRAVYQLNAKSDAPTETWKIAVLGSASVNGGTVYVSSQLAPLAVADPYLLAKIETSSGQPGQKAKLVCKLEQKVPFEGKATIKLLGLSDKIKTTEQEITKDDTEVVFPLEIDPKCPTGSQRSLFCQVVIRKNDEFISQSLANGGVFRVVPPKKNETKVAAKAD